MFAVAQNVYDMIPPHAWSFVREARSTPPCPLRKQLFISRQTDLPAQPRGVYPNYYRKKGPFTPIITEKRGRLPQLLPCARGDFTFLFCFCWGVYPGYCPFFAEFLRPEEFTIPGMAFTSISTVCFIFLVCARVLELDMK